MGDETECNILGRGRELIATVSDNEACLIAASPELLEMLESIYENGLHDKSGLLQLINKAKGLK